MIDATVERVPLGDCLLHLAHHAMAPECWAVVIDHYMQVMDVDPDVDQADAVNSYKTVYERALLNAIRDEAANV